MLTGKTIPEMEQGVQLTGTIRKHNGENSHDSRELPTNDWSLITRRVEHYEGN